MRTALHGCAGAATLGCLVLAACSSGTVPSQVLTKPAPTSAPAPAVRANGPWVYRPSTERQAFAVDQQAAVAVRVDTSTRTDTVSSHAQVAFSIAPATHGVTGEVVAFVVQDAARTPGTPTGLVTPFPIRAEYTARGLQLDFTAPYNAEPCSSTALAVAQSLRDLWFRPPDTLRVGSTWSDSSAYVVCRDGIPLRATAHRVFHVSGMTAAEGRVLLSISRMGRTTIDGTGSQFGAPVEIRGSGSGQLIYNFDPVAGEIFDASGSATLDLSLHSNLSTQLVHQAAEIRISRR